MPICSLLAGRAVETAHTRAVARSRTERRDAIDGPPKRTGINFIEPSSGKIRNIYIRWCVHACHVTHSQASRTFPARAGTRYASPPVRNK